MSDINLLPVPFKTFVADDGSTIDQIDLATVLGGCRCKDCLPCWERVSAAIGRDNSLTSNGSPNRKEAHDY